MSICDIESYRFEPYYLPMLVRYKNLKNFKLQIKQIVFFNLSNVFFLQSFFKKNCFFKNGLSNFVFFKKTVNTFFVNKYNRFFKNNYLYFVFKKNRVTKFTNKYSSNTWSIGMLLVLLDLDKKFLRRTLKGYKILLNFLNLMVIRKFKKGHKAILMFNNINNQFFFL